MKRKRPVARLGVDKMIIYLNRMKEGKEHLTNWFGKRIWIKKEGNKIVFRKAFDYETLEEQIVKLWKSRGMEVLEEHFRGLGKDKGEWRIIAKFKKGRR